MVGSVSLLWVTICTSSPLLKVNVGPGKVPPGAIMLIFEVDKRTTTDMTTNVRPREAIRSEDLVFDDYVIVFCNSGDDGKEREYNEQAGTR